MIEQYARFFIASLLCIAMLTGCAALSAIPGLIGGGDSLVVETQIGDDDTQIGSRENLTTNSGDISTQETIVNEGPSWWMILLLLAGWMLPDPYRMWAGMKRLLGMRLK